MLAEFSDREERPAWVQFELRPIEDKPASLKSGRSISKDVEFALVTPPYSKDCFEFKAAQWFKNQEMNVRNSRIPQKWLDYWRNCYDHWKLGLDTPLNGTDIRNWPVISPAQVKNLLSANCRTIEDLAGVNEEGLKRIGMGGVALKQKAQAYISAAKDHGPVVMENAELKNKVTQLEGAIESLQIQIKGLVDQTEDVTETVEEISAADIFDEPVLDEKPIEEQFFDLYGTKPHHLMKPETIRKKVEEARK